MNRWLVSISTAAVAGLAMAATNVESSNIVGYTEQATTKNTFVPIAVQFVNVADCASRAIPVTNLLQIATPRAGARVMNSVDQIHVWDSATAAWKIYFNKTGVGFVASDAVDQTVATSDTVNAGDGVFFRRSSYGNCDVKTVGGCYTGNTVSYQLAKNTFTAVSYPWATDFAISNFVNCVSNPRAGARVMNSVDQVHVWNPATSDWTIYFNKTGVGYVASDAVDQTVATEAVLVPGQSAFFRRSSYGADTLTFTKPAGL